MKIFVTGGTGFIGSRTVPKLAARGHRLLVLSRRAPRRPYDPSVRFVKGDLRDPRRWERAFRTFKPDAVLHLAWEGLEDRDFGPAVSAVNVTNSLRLVSLAASAGCKKFLSTGSCWEYGATSGRLRESDVLRKPNHVPAFVAAKRAISDLGEQLALGHKMQFLWARLFFVYGPGQRQGALVPYLARNIQKGLSPKIQNRAGGNDFVYVDDVAEALLRILEKGRRSAVYNVGSGRLISVRRVAREVYAVLRFPAPRWCLARVHPRGFYASIAHIKREIGWTPQTSFSEGVRNTVTSLKEK